ncbi:MAG: His/Gly/Thr/Pro-type tRNA ligase C-terminal domain-containing protein, partial [Pseudomonadota bacterium]
HRALLGSLERFTGIMIENYSGEFPLWLAPVQAVVMNITDAQADYAREVQKAMNAQGIRTEIDLRNEKIGYKIRTQTLDKVPYMIVIGDREVENREVAVRKRDGSNLGTMSVDALVNRLSEEVAERRAIGEEISDN